MDRIFFSDFQDNVAGFLPSSLVSENTWTCYRRSWGGKGRLAEERRERGTGGDTYFPRARLARGNFATRVFPKIYVCPCHRLTTSLACYGYYRALAFVRDASESYHPITVWPFRHLRDAIRKFLRRMFFPAESAASGISFQRRISLIFTRWSTPLRGRRY